MVNDNYNKQNIKNRNFQNITYVNNKQSNPNYMQTINREIYQNAKANSINKTIQKYEPKKKKFPIKIIASALAVVLTITAGISSINTYKEHANINSQLVEMVMPQYDGGNIMSHSSERTINNDGFYYDTSKLARNIVKCDPEYFDLIIYNAYENMDYGREKNMNQLFEDLRTYSYNISETNPELFYKIQNIKDFNDYLVKIKCVDENNQPSLKKYKKNGEYLYEYFEESLEKNYGGKSK